MHHFPLFLELTKASVLVVARGEMAAREIDLLIKAKALITLVDPNPQPELVRVVLRHHGEVFYSDYKSYQLYGKRLVIAATGDDVCNQRIAEDAKVQNILVNVVNNLKRSNAIVPAIIDRSPVSIAITSSGTAPMLTRLLRAKLDSIIPTSTGKVARLLSHYKMVVKSTFSSIPMRQKLWEQYLDNGTMEKLLTGREKQSEETVTQQLQTDVKPEGEVYLIGAGAGNIELLTLKGLRLLQQADVVLYDNLVTKDIIDLARNDAQKINVGKLNGGVHFPQEETNRLLCDFALQGLKVARLKGGDPFVFGRGGEEMDALRDANVNFQIVPGITAANACTAYAGFPLTHRNHAQSVQFIAGQCQSKNKINFKGLVNDKQTLVFYMGLNNVDEICRQLIRHGKPSSTPAAIISHGGLETQQVVVSDLAGLGQQQASLLLPPPALIVVGEVVSMASDTRWFDKKECQTVEASSIQKQMFEQLEGYL